MNFEETELYQFILNYLKHEYDMMWKMINHEILWGVPCGPTISMVLV